ncbi:MAG: hypothetical protein IJD54_03885, partial [Clostridia bacterium]|nr:hypothetical protein [Clostridia bacterium]
KVLALIEKYDILDSVNVIELTKENFTLLQTATSGYYILKEPIDMSTIAYSPAHTDSSRFVGIFNGAGNKIYNFTPTSAGGRGGLFEYTGAGAVIKNLDIHVLDKNTKACLIGWVMGQTTIQNCSIDVDNLSGNYSGVFVNVMRSTLTIKDTYINLDNAISTYYVGFVASGEADAGGSVIISNVYCYDKKGLLTTPFTGYNGGSSLGLDNAAAEDGTDYFLYSSENELKAAQSAGDLSNEFEAFLVECGVLTAASNG